MASLGREGDRKTIHPDSPGFFGDLWELVRGEPIMVLAVYGIPVVLLLTGLLSGVLVGWNALRGAEPASPWVRRIALLYAAFPAYWVLASGYAIVERVRRSRWKAVKGPTETGSREAGERPEGPPALVITSPPEPPQHPDAFRFHRIGLVVAGGGAKGVYQAGAMKAIYEFLHQRGALDCVVSVAGTSIGSWNALFWLAGLLDPASGDGQRSRHEQWWTQTNLRDLVRPAVLKIPGLSTALMNNAPWRRQFEALFCQADTLPHQRLTEVLADKVGTHFYLTRTNVLEGRLAFDTNNQTVIRGADQTHDLDRARLTTSLQALKIAVFTSMGIPPLFPYTRVADPSAATWCEDGGVIDNLPIRLATAFDNCDLLFILPLNASFYRTDLPNFLVTRLSRVVDVRGGILERTALKNIYLFNQRVALTGKGRPVPAFVIAPGQMLRVNTTELWKLRRHGPEVFEQMYLATKQALDEFFQASKLGAFYDAFAEYQRPPHRLPREGYVNMSIVDPDWEEGNPFSAEWRF